MGIDDLKRRYFQFGMAMLKLADMLPRTRSGDAVGRQLSRSGTGAAANYRASCRGKSKADFIAKMGIVEEELDESLFWLEVSREGKMLPPNALDPWTKEGNELLAITVKSIQTARGGNRCGQVR